MSEPTQRSRAVVVRELAANVVSASELFAERAFPIDALEVVARAACARLTTDVLSSIVASRLEELAEARVFFRVNEDREAALDVVYERFTSQLGEELDDDAPVGPVTTQAERASVQTAEEGACCGDCDGGCDVTEPPPSPYPQLSQWLVLQVGGERRLAGNIANDPRFPTGSRVLTSPIVRMPEQSGGRLLSETRSGTVYELLDQYVVAEPVLQ